MATALFTVKATITPDREQAFNEWYNHEHVPDVFKWKGVVSARRYKAILAEDRFQYMAVNESESEETLRRLEDLYRSGGTSGAPRTGRVVVRG